MRDSEVGLKLTIQLDIWIIWQVHDWNCVDILCTLIFKAFLFDTVCFAHPFSYGNFRYTPSYVLFPPWCYQLPSHSMSPHFIQLSASRPHLTLHNVHWTEDLIIIGSAAGQTAPIHWLFMATVILPSDKAPRKYKSKYRNVGACDWFDLLSYLPIFTSTLLSRLRPSTICPTAMLSNQQPVGREKVRRMVLIWTERSMKGRYSAYQCKTAAKNG